MVNTQKGFAHVILIFVLILAGIGTLGYFAYKNGQIKITFDKTPTPSPDSPITVKETSSHTYKNKIAPYSFIYTNNENVISVGGYEGPPEESDAIVITDAKDENIGLLDIGLQTPPTGRFLKNEQEALDEIVGYKSSSTGSFFNPELNEVTGPIKENINTDNLSTGSTVSYRYEINWENDPCCTEGGMGTEVWIFIPVKANWQIDPNRLGNLDDKYTFLWIEYDKSDEARLKPLLDSLTLHEVN